MAGWATAISAGPADESGQALTFLVTTNNDPLFAVLPAVSSTGTLTYTPAANASGTATVFIALQDNGGSNDTSPTQQFTITVTAVNDPPTANAQSVNTNEDTPLGITLTGSDAETPSGSLIFNVTVLPTNGVLSGTGANRTYTPNAGYQGPDSFKFTVTDTGAPALTSAEATVSITVDAVNDAPVNTVPGAQSTAENAAFAFSAGNGNLISIADSDAGSNPVQVTLTAANGTISLNGTAGLSFSAGDGTADATMTFTGTIASINSALNGLVFTPAAGFSGNASLQIVTNDLGNTGSGGALSDTDSVNITVNDGGALQFSSATYTVSESTANATITINRVGGTAGTATVLFQTVIGGSADAGDFTTVSQVVTFVPGDTTETVDIPILNNATNEPNETVNLTLSSPGGSGALGSPVAAVLTINDDDVAGGVIQFNSTTQSISEGATNTPQGFANVSVQVNRTGDTTGAATVRYATNEPAGTSALDCNVNNTGNASQRCDYLMLSGKIRFEAGETVKTVEIPIVNDVYVEPSEQFTIQLSTIPGGGGSIGPNGVTTITITDNDTTAPTSATNPYLNNPFFVRMHYLDFLEREPDTAGFNDWVNVLNNCNPNQGFLGAPTTCDRAHVSIGFFGATEFIDRGFLVYRLYDVGLARLPDYATEYNPDSAQLRGFGLTAAQIQQNLDAYLLEFGARTEFVNRYAAVAAPGQASQLITLLETTAGVTLPASPAVVVGPTQYGRAELINLRATGQLNLVQTVKAFVEQKVVYDKEYPSGFVTMQYFNYLKRNPDMAGRADWIDVLVNGRPAQGIAPGNFRHLIFGFIYSVEYRQRFGTP